MANAKRSTFTAWKLSGQLMLAALATMSAGVVCATEISPAPTTQHFALAAPPHVQIAGTLRVLPQNPRYFTDDTGGAIYLTGSHTWVNFKDYGVADPPPAFDYTAFLQFLEDHNHNFFRLWSWEMPHSALGALGQMWYRTSFPWLRTGPGTATDGKPKFDLSQFDDSYFARLASCVAEAESRGLYVAVMLWDGYGLQFNRSAAVDGFPYDSRNNINGISSGGTESQSLTNNAVTANQEAYLRRVIETVNGFDNVLYEIANEAGLYSTAWQYHMINLTKQIELAMPKQHPVGMTYQYSGGSDQALYNSPADWISTSERFPAATGSKVIFNDTDHSYGWTTLLSEGPAAHQTWAWKNFTRGCNTGFMDPYLVDWPGRNIPSGGNPDPYWERIRNALGRTRSYATRMNLSAAPPSGNLTSTGYCLANPGVEYLVYQPNSNQSFTVDLAAGSYVREWYNPTTGVVTGTAQITAAGGSLAFTAPFSGDAVLYLKVPVVLAAAEGTRDAARLALDHITNPARDGRLQVTFSLPSNAAATLEAVDVSGRRVVVREVGSLGAGRHRIDLRPERRLSRGMYFVRLTQDGRVATARVAVLD